MNQYINFHLLLFRLISLTLVSLSYLTTLGLTTNTTHDYSLHVYLTLPVLQITSFNIYIYLWVMHLNE